MREFGRDWELYNMAEDRTEPPDQRDRSEDRAKGMIREFDDWAHNVGVVDSDIVRQHPAMNWKKDLRKSQFNSTD